jgi:hypothetical protein
VVNARALKSSAFAAGSSVEATATALMCQQMCKDIVALCRRAGVHTLGSLLLLWATGE